MAPDGTEFEARADYTVIADGANSQFGRALGTFREPTWPYGLAHHGAFPVGRARLRSRRVRARSSRPVGHAHRRSRLDVPDRRRHDHRRGDHDVDGGIVPGGEAGQPLPPTRRSASRQLGDHWWADRDRRSVAGCPSVSPSVRPPDRPTCWSATPSVQRIPCRAPGSRAHWKPGATQPRSSTKRFARVTPHTCSGTRECSPTGTAGTTRWVVWRLGCWASPAIARRTERVVTHRRSFAEAYLRITTDSLRSGPRVGAPETAYRVGRAISMFAPDA